MWSSSRRHRVARWWLLAAALVLAACAGKLSWQDMAEQPRYETYEGSETLDDGQSALQLVPGTVPRGELQEDELLFSGLSPDGVPGDLFPFPITRAVLERGQEYFNAYCVPCHDYAGAGAGVVVERGFPAPPSLHIDRLRDAPPGYLFGVITNGVGAMPAYGTQILARDRWAIVAYVRALQLSQHATLDDVPEAEREALEARGEAP